MRNLTAAILGLTMIVGPSHAADILGRYDVQGKGPNGSTYTGTVEVTRTGDQTFDVIWTIGSKRSAGTGIGGDGFLAVGYSNKDSYGVGAYFGKDDGVQGVWTYAGGKTIGAEVWTRAAGPAAGR